MSSPSYRFSPNEEILRISRSNEFVREYRKSDGTVRHKCFLSYYSEDASEVLTFVNRYDDIFIPRAVGISEDFPWVDSDNDDYVMDVIRDDYLADSTVTLAFIGRCSWSRKFIDWEVYSSLRLSKNNRLNGLLAIQLPSAAGPPNPKLPERINKNVKRDDRGEDTGYARYIAYPATDNRVRDCIEDAFQARTKRADLRVLGGVRRLRNSPCP